MTARDGSLELSFGDYRRGSSRKPPRPHARRRRCVSEDARTRQISGRLTTFQKLDREMGRFVKAQNYAGKSNQNNAAPGLMQVVSEEESCSVRGVRHGVKWKCGWMFEQDSLYWETVRRQEIDHNSSAEKPEPLSFTTCDDSSSTGEDALRHHCSTDHESVSSGMELHLRRSHARRRGPSTEKLPVSTPDDAAKGWPAVLQAKCEVLQMEKELADQRLRQQCADMAQAAEMAHCLRASVQTILEVNTSYILVNPTVRFIDIFISHCI